MSDWHVDTSRETLDVARKGTIAQVILKGPGRGNAMSPTFWGECAATFDALSADDSVRVVLVRGAGDHFTYGLDLMATAPVFGPMLAEPGTAGPRTKLYRMIQEWQQAFDAIERCAKPVIAAIDGWCIGGGMNLIAACDMRVCSSRAQFSVREVKLAIVADLGALQRLPAIIGEGWTRRLAMSGENIDAEKAAQIGLVEEVFADADALHAGAEALAAQVAANPPLTVQGIKEVMGFERRRAMAAGEQFVAAWNSAFLVSDDMAEAITAFMERRDPDFKGS